MTTPADDDLPQPRDIVLEVATPEQVEELEAASDDGRGLGSGEPGVGDGHGEP